MNFSVPDQERAGLCRDGDISYMYIDGVTPPLEDTNWFAGIFTITEK